MCSASSFTAVCLSEFVSQNLPLSLPLPLCFSSSLCHFLSSFFSTSFLTLPTFWFPLFPPPFFGAVLLHLCQCFFLCFLPFFSMSLSLFRCFWLCFLLFFSISTLSLSVSLSLGRLQQQQTTGGLIVSNGETLRSEGLLASQRERVNTTHNE